MQRRQMGPDGLTVPEIGRPTKLGRAGNNPDGYTRAHVRDFIRGPY